MTVITHQPLWCYTKSAGDILSCGPSSRPMFVFLFVCLSVSVYCWPASVLQEFMRGGEQLEELISALLEHSDQEALLELVQSSHLLRRETDPGSDHWAASTLNNDRLASTEWTDTGEKLPLNSWRPVLGRQKWFVLTRDPTCRGSWPGCYSEVRESTFQRWHWF